jgi:hypothetical protein
LKHIKPLIW